MTEATRPPFAGYRLCVCTFRVVAVLLLLASRTELHADTHYVSLSGFHVAPFTNWNDAATNIQDAVNATETGDAVLVTNGTYYIPSEITISNAIVVRGVGGNRDVIVDGCWSNRCFFLSHSNAVLDGLTITRGWGSVAGVYCAQTSLVMNCVISNNYGTGASGGSISNCLITQNDGPGVVHCNVFNSTIRANYAENGGGAFDSTINNSSISENIAIVSGGGAIGCTIRNCTVTGNMAFQSGGGTEDCSVYNSVVYYNSAPLGENFHLGTNTYTCTTPNLGGMGNVVSEPELADVFHLSSNSPCIAAGNPSLTTGTDISGGPWASPPSMGCDQYIVGSRTGSLSATIRADYTNVAANFAVRLAAEAIGKPSRSVWSFGDGTQATNRPHVTHTWSSPGEYPVVLTFYNDSYPDGVSATIAVRVVPQPIHYVSRESISPTPPYTSWSTAATNIQDAIDASIVVGAKVFVTNGVYSNGASVAPAMANWLVQDTGRNRIVVTTAICIASVNGPAVTTILGEGPPGTSEVRCAIMCGGSVLSGFTLSGGCSSNRGGGVKGAFAMGSQSLLPLPVITNCVVTGNFALPYGDSAGLFGCYAVDCVIADNIAAGPAGADYCAIRNSVLRGNQATFLWGGGAGMSTLINCIIQGNTGAGFRNGYIQNCTVVGNSPFGVVDAGVENSIVFYNEQNLLDSTAEYCCSTPLPPGKGNISGEPCFVDTNSWSDLRLRSVSPCIDAGTNGLWTETATELDGKPRIINGRVDIGAYEVGHAILSSANEHGTIDPQGLVGVAPGSNVSFTITPGAHCFITDVSVDDVSLGITNAYAFNNVTNDHAISATFGIETYTFNITSHYGQGNPSDLTTNDWNAMMFASIAGSPLIVGQTQYVCTGWTGTGSVAPSGTATNTSFNITNDSSITWNWKTQYMYSATAVSHGSVLSSNGWYDLGASGVAATALPFDGYHFVCWTGSVDSTANPLIMTVDQAVDVAANFAINQYTVTVAGVVNGTISPAGPSVIVTYGDSTSFLITADTHYHVADVRVDQSSVGPVTNYNFVDISNSHAIDALFAIDSNTLTVVSANGAPFPDGATIHAWNTPIAASVGGSPSTIGDMRCVCTGWTGTGSVAPSGTTTNTSFNITNDSSITWNWKTQYMATASAGLGGTVSSAAPVWVDSGGNGPLCIAVPLAGKHVELWYVNGVAARAGGTVFTPTAISSAVDVLVTFMSHPAVSNAVDFDGDMTSDITVYWPQGGTWYIRNSAGGSTNINWGWSAAMPIPGDYDGDGMADIAVYWPQGGTWYVRKSGGGSTNISWGWSAAVPVPGDYDGDGISDIAVYWPQGGTWYIRNSAGGSTNISWGWSAAVPVPGDYDGDGMSDIAVYWPQGGAWYIKYSGGGTLTQNWGWSAAVPVPADYDGDGKADIAVYWPQGGTWYIRNSAGGSTNINWGWSAAQPVLPQYQINKWMRLLP